MVCTAWVTEEELAECYTIPEGTPQDVIDNALTAASEILYALTDRS